MSNIIFIIDNGHGGVIDGVPQTKGKRSPDFGDGILYEGVSNRRLADKVIKKCTELGILCIKLVPELEDISLKERVKRVNNLDRKYKAVLISIHSDAFSEEQAHGWSAYTSKGETKSDRLATILYKNAKKENLKLRTDFSDKDPDKEADFYLLRKTTCPAVLVENLFMTNERDYNYLKSAKGQHILSKIIVESIKEIFKHGI